VFENTTDIPDIGGGPTLETVQSNMVYAITGVVRKLATTAQNTPIVNTYLGGLMPPWSLINARRVRPYGVRVDGAS
jgi:hypothetical protein